MTAQAILNRAGFRNALALAVKIVERRQTTPILANIALRSAGDSVIVQSTDLDIMATVTMPGTLADDAFGVTIPAHLLRDIEKKAPASDDVEMSTDGTNSTMRLGRVKFDVQGLPMIDWEELAVTGTIHGDFSVNASALVAALDSVAGSISTEETRYYLNGVYMHGTQDQNGADVLRFVSTDGHRLRLRDIPASQLSDDAAAQLPNMPGVIIPRKTVAFMLDAFKRKGRPDVVRVIVNTSKARFVSGNVDIVTKLIDGSFPDYSRVIPTRNDKRATVDRKELAECIKAVTCISSERGRAVKLTFSKAGTLTLAVSNPDAGKSETVMPCTWSGPEYCDGEEIGFNSVYLLAECDEYAGDALTFEIQEPGSPALLYAGPDKGGSHSVLMPMRV